ncbi:hypothetical protein J132_03802 [Termitomyces sp. J132]|nr:hypothetical protein J132_03802 [Termitomyces sp. J132]
MWAKPCEIHSKSAPNACFNSLSDLFNICLHDNKTLTQLCMCVEGAMQRIQVLHPTMPVLGPNEITSLGYTLEMLDDKLSTMAMLHALPCNEYSSFISSVLMLSALTKDADLEAFCNEKVQHCAVEDKAAAAGHNFTCYL